MSKMEFAKLAALAAIAVLATACSPGGAAGNNPAHDAGGAGDGGETVSVTAPLVPAAEVVAAVKAAENLKTVPDGVAGSLAQEDNAAARPYFDCRKIPAADNPTDANPFGQCAWGDPKGGKLMVIYGDSHAPMWNNALAAVGAKQGWKVRVFSMGECPVPDLEFLSYQTNTPNTKCDEFRSSAIPAIRGLHPDLVIGTSISDHKLADGTMPTAAQWQDGWISTINKLSQPGTKFAILGDIPVWSKNDARCLAAHLEAVQDCSAPADSTMPKNVPAEQAAAQKVGALYIPTGQWICADTCQPVIADTRVFNNEYHLTRSYVLYLAGAVSEALQPALA